MVSAWELGSRDRRLGLLLGIRLRYRNRFLRASYSFLCQETNSGLPKNELQSYCYWRSTSSRVSKLPRAQSFIYTSIQCSSTSQTPQTDLAQLVHLYSYILETRDARSSRIEVCGARWLMPAHSITHHCTVYRLAVCAWPLRFSSCSTNLPIQIFFFRPLIRIAE